MPLHVDSKVNFIALMYRIMVVDDEAIDNYITLTVLNKSKLDLSLTVVSNGKDALNRLEASPQLPDAMLLDLHMPFADGFYVIEKARKILTDRNKQMKIIMLTTPNTTLSLRPEKLGITAVLAKPLDLVAFERILSGD